MFVSNIGMSGRRNRARGAEACEGKKTVGTSLKKQDLINMLGNLAYVAKRQLDDGLVIDCKWEPLIEQEVFDRVQAKLAKNSKVRPTSKAPEHALLLEGLLRCGRCGSAMTRASATGRNASSPYYRCNLRHRSHGADCNAKQVPARAVEKFVLDQLRRYAAAPATIVKAVTDANAGRDVELARIHRELASARAAYAQRGEKLNRLLDALEDGGADSMLRERIRAKEAERASLRAQISDLETKRHVLHQHVLDSLVVAEGYQKLPRLLDEAEAPTSLSSSSRV